MRANSSWAAPSEDEKVRPDEVPGRVLARDAMELTQGRNIVWMGKGANWQADVPFDSRRVAWNAGGRCRTSYGNVGVRYQ